VQDTTLRCRDLRFAKTSGLRNTPTLRWRELSLAVAFVPLGRLVQQGASLKPAMHNSAGSKLGHKPRDLGRARLSLRCSMHGSRRRLTCGSGDDRSLAIQACRSRDMTLIACFHPSQCRTLLADILISSNAPETPDLVLPTRAYLSPEQRRGMEFKPAAFRRKIVEITPKLVLLWAGDYNYAKKSAIRMTEKFNVIEANEETIARFVKEYLPSPVGNFGALIVPSGTDWFYALGDVTQSSSSFAGEYAAAGEGTKLFQRVVTLLSPRDNNTIAPHVDGLRLANDLLAYEINTAETIRSRFGGGYEVFFEGRQGFEKVNDVIHFFTSAGRTGPTELTLSHYTHATRQWYEGNRLCIASLASPVGAEQELGFEGFVVPSLLDDEDLEPVYVRAEFFGQRPSHMCVHHISEYEGRTRSFTLTLSGDQIGQYYRIETDGLQVHFHPTSSYVESVHKQWSAMMAQIRNGGSEDQI
jgi:hypothetical protein